jgi:subtilisin family serine protease
MKEVSSFLPFPCHEFTGKGVSVGIVDTGVNPRHSHVRTVAGGIKVTLESGGKVIITDDYADNIGHGTAIAGVIKKSAPDADLFAIKVFEDSHRTFSPIIISALEWAISHGIKVINLSLGTTNKDHLSRLQATCNHAHNKGVIIVAAGNHKGEYPAVLPQVIGGSWDERCKEDEYYYCDGDPIEFRAYGYPRPLPFLPQGLNLKGSSFAAAYITGLVSLILERYPDADLKRIREILIANASLY